MQPSRAHVDEILDFLSTSAAAGRVRRHLATCGFPTDPVLVDDVLEEARLVVLGRSVAGVSVDGPAAADGPSEKAERILVTVVDDLSRPRHSVRAHAVDRSTGLTVLPDGDPDGSSAGDHSQLVPGPIVDMIRTALPATGAPQWAISAALAYLTILEDPTVVPVDAVTPPDGTGVDRARAWVALWCSGSEHLFDEPSRSTGSSMREGAVDQLVQLIDDLVVRCSLRSGPHHG